MSKKSMYSYPAIGGWLKERIKEAGVTNKALINDSGIRREVFYRLLKGGCEV